MPSVAADGRGKGETIAFGTPGRNVDSLDGPLDTIVHKDIPQPIPIVWDEIVCIRNEGYESTVVADMRFFAIVIPLNSVGCDADAFYCFRGAIEKKDIGKVIVIIRYEIVRERGKGDPLAVAACGRRIAASVAQLT